MTLMRKQDVDRHIRCANDLLLNDLHQHGRTIIVKKSEGMANPIWYHSTALGFTQMRISTGKGAKKRN